MNELERQEKALEVGRRLFRLEAQRDEIERQIATAKQEFLELIQTPGGGMQHTNGSAQRGADARPDTTKSVRLRMLEFVATSSEPVPQDRVVQAMVTAGVHPATAKQAAYDLTSQKVAWLERTQKGLIVSEKGRAELGKH